MTREVFFPLTAAGLCTALILTSGCASRKDIVQINERMQVLERDVRAAQTGVEAGKEETHDLDLRVEYLEREAGRRGVPIPPRRPKAVAPVEPQTQGQAAQQTPGKMTPEAAAQAAAQAASTPVKTPAAPAGLGGAKTETPTVGELPLSPKVAAPEPSGGRIVHPAPPKGTPTTGRTAPAKPANAKPAPAAKLEEVKTSPATPASPATAAGSLPTPSPTAPAVPSVMPKVSESTPATPNPPSTPAAAPARPEQKAYDAALQLYRTGRFPQAEAAFQAFLEVYPNSRLVPNALYWKGETYYSRGRYSDAIFSFKDVQTRFPKNQKTPDSLLKTAMAYKKLGDEANAALHLSVLYEDWPKAEASQRARSMGLKP